MNDLIFAGMAGTTGAAREALLWARSIRTFAGRFAMAPIWLMVPDHKERLPVSIRVEFERLAVRLISFAAGSTQLDFPFAGKTLAAGAAETLAQGHSTLLVWMDRDSLVLQEPLPLLLPADQSLGYRPVDHRLIGSLISEPVDPFWSLIYNYLGVDAQQVASMLTTVDQETIRAYFNAGMLVVRPEQAILRTWSENFTRLYAQPAFSPFYEQDILYRLFMHQALLTGTILTLTDYRERWQLPHLVNYPLHMHTSYPPTLRAARLNDVTTCRYDTLVTDPHWDQIIAIDEPVQSWLREQRRALDLI